MRRYIHIVALLAFCCAIDSCRGLDEVGVPVDYQLSLTADVLEMSGEGTRADLLNHDSTIPGNTLKLFGWENGTLWLNGVTATYSSGEWTVPGDNKIKKGSDYHFLAYANKPSSGADVTDPASKDGNITYTVTDIAAAQNDVLLGGETMEDAVSGNAEIDFSHPYASVKFKVGNLTGVNSITGISLTGLYASGKTTYSLTSSKDGNEVVNYTWTNLGNANATLEMTGLSKTEGQDIATFVVIPQNLSEKNAVVTITDNTGSTLSTVLSNEIWTAGYTTTYTLSKIDNVEVAISETTITNSGSSKTYVRAVITGAWYDASGNIVAPWSTADGTFTGLPGSGWSGSEGIYYYATGLVNGQSTSKLYTSYAKPSAPVTGATLKLDILVQAIPYDVNKTCQEAFAAL